MQSLVGIGQYEPNARLFLAFGIPYFAGMGLYGLLYNLYLKRLGYQEDFIGLLAAMTPLASGICALPIGVWSDRVGRKPFLLAAALLLALAQAGMCLTTDRTALLALGMLGGISAGMVFVNHVPFMAENCRPEHRGRLISLGFTTQILTRMLLSLAGGSLPLLFATLLTIPSDHPNAYRGALLLGAYITALAAIPVYRMREQTRGRRDGATGRRGDGETRRGEEEGGKELDLNTQHPTPNTQHSLTPSPPHPLTGSPWPVLLTLAGLSAFRGLSMGMTMPFFNVFFEERYRTPAAVIGFIFFVSQAASMPSALISSRLPDRFGTIRSLVVLRLVMVASLALLGHGGLVLAVPLFLIYTACESAATPVEMGFATDAVPPEYWGRAQSLRVMAFQLLMAVGSVTAGKLILLAGYATNFLVAAFLLLGGVLVTLLGLSHLRTAENAEGTS